MRSHSALAWLVLALAALVADPARAQAQTGPAPATAPSDATEAARAHFKTGMKLFSDQNFAGALAEFEAAYEIKPGPGSLQNVALCQKALFRYGEAADSLTLLLTRHDAELSDAERAAAKRARDELVALVGTVSLVIVPPTAEVTVDGRPLVGADRSGRVRLNVGEHTLAATAPGYSRVAKTIQVASGQSETSVDLTLAPTAGFIDVRSADESASIAIDGKPAAFGHIFAAVTPNEEHVIAIYKEGTTPFETRVTVKLGKTVIVNGQPGAPSLTPSEAQAAPSATGAPGKRYLGWYGMGSLGLLTTGNTPFKFDLTDAKSSAFSIGVHGGYRLKPAVALDGLLEYEALRVRGACDEFANEQRSGQVLCGDEDSTLVSYTIRSLRFGPTLELMTTDPRFRALGGLGVGAVWHQLSMGDQRGKGVDPYLLLELGIGANTKHVIFVLALQTLVDGTGQMIKDRTLNNYANVEVRENAFDRSGGALAWVGLNLRVGYSQWSP